MERTTGHHFPLLATVLAGVSLLLLGPTAALAQPSPDWRSTYDPTNDDDTPLRIVSDGSGGVYVGGEQGDGSGNSDILITRFDPSGTRMWAQTYDGSGNADDDIADIVNDPTGGVYVCGAADNGSNDDFFVWALAADGTTRWMDTYSLANGDDEANAIDVDSAGNVFVTGTADSGTSSDDEIVTRAYNNLGTAQWTKVVNGPDSGFDSALDVRVGPAAQVYVTGLVDTSSDEDAVTIAYDFGGIQQWMVTADSGSGQDDLGIRIEFVNNLVVVLGLANSSSNNADLLLIGYTRGGTQQWRTIYDTPGNATQTILPDLQQSIVVVDDRIVVITIVGGISSGDAAITGFDTSGTQQWRDTFAGSFGGQDVFTSIVAGASDSVFVCGVTEVAAVNGDALLAEYDVSSGNQEFLTTVTAGSNSNVAFAVTRTGDEGDIVYTGVETVAAQDQLVVTNFDGLSPTPSGGGGCGYQLRGPGRAALLLLLGLMLLGLLAVRRPARDRDKLARNGASG